jgi:hypothetical protein
MRHRHKLLAPFASRCSRELKAAAGMLTQGIGLQYTQTGQSNCNAVVRECWLTCLGHMSGCERVLAAGCSGVQQDAAGCSRMQQIGLGVP